MVKYAINGTHFCYCYLREVHLSSEILEQAGDSEKGLEMQAPGRMPSEYVLSARNGWLCRAETSLSESAVWGARYWASTHIQHSLSCGLRMLGTVEMFSLQINGCLLSRRHLFSSHTQRKHVSHSESHVTL